LFICQSLFGLIDPESKLIHSPIRVFTILRINPYLNMS
jgi:hypothetical protein